jgi:hypothetical protein
MDVSRDARLRTAWVAAVVLLAVTAGLYARTLAYPYVYEDKNDPRSFAQPWPAVQFSATGDIQYTHYPVTPRLLTAISYTLTHRWLDDSAHGDHLGNVAIHLLVGSLVFLAASRLIGPWPAVIALGFFLPWPTQTETVAYVSGRADLMVAVGFAVSLLGLAYQAWGIVAVGWLVAGLSKEIGVMVVPLTLLVAWWRQIEIPLLIRRICALGVCAAALWLWRLKLTHLSLGMFPILLTQWTRLLGYLVWPVGLSIWHDWSWITPTIAAGVMAAWLLAFWLAERRRSVLFLLSFCLLAILPRLFATEPEPLHEHHTYLASIGIGLWAGKVIA